MKCKLIFLNIVQMVNGNFHMSYLINRKGDNILGEKKNEI